MGRSFELVESKFHPPSGRPGIVPRTVLVERLLASKTTPIIGVVAPAGYGKTTLLGQWAERTGRWVAWVSVDQRDNDPVVLLTYIAVALDRVEPIDQEVFQALASLGAAILATVVPRLAAAVAAMTEPVAVVLDHLEPLDNRECLDAVAELAVRLPEGSQLVLASRRTPPLPVALLRAHGQMVEIGVDELAMDQREARALLEGAGVGLTDTEVAELTSRTEGWPVGLYLAALAHKAGGQQHHSGLGFTGDDRSMADYLRSELLAHLPPELVVFLTGPRCWSACLDPCATRSSSSAVRTGSWSRLRTPTCWWSRWTGTGSGTATTICSVSCSGLSFSGVSPSWSSSCTLGRPRGVRPTGWRSWPSTMPRPPATPTGLPGWSPAWPNPPTPPGGSTPPADGSRGSKTRN